MVATLDTNPNRVVTHCHEHGFLKAFECYGPVIIRRTGTYAYRCKTCLKNWRKARRLRNGEGKPLTLTVVAG